MIDIHSHILSGIDDGPKKIEESCVMLINASTSGVETIVATPHLVDGASKERIAECNRKVNELQYIARAREISIDIKVGFECYITPELTNSNLDLAEITINNNGKYILVEFPMYNIPFYAKDIFANMKEKGITPILAHPERNLAIIQNPNILFDLVSNGCIAQLNAGSILGRYGRTINGTARILLSHKMIHLVASDMHSSSSPLIAQSLSAISAIVGHDRASFMSNDIPKSIIMGEDFEIDKPIQYKPERKNIKYYLSKWRNKRKT